jgi:hypothetical protein
MIRAIATAMVIAAASPQVAHAPAPRSCKPVR